MPRSAVHPTSGVYLIRSHATGLVKIGMSKDVDARLTSLQAASGETMELLATFDGGWRVEQWLHATFGVRRVRGEWFDFSGCDPVADVAEVLATR